MTDAITPRAGRARLDPELQKALGDIPIGPAGLFDLGDLPRARRELHAFAQLVATNDDLQVTIEIHRAEIDGMSPIPLRLFRPMASPAIRPALLWFHGGGQLLGFAAQEDAYLKRLSHEVGCIVVSVDYRLAPEAPSPAGAEDGYGAYRWVRIAAGQLGIDAWRIGLAGASGGGCIAAATALMIRDRGDPSPVFQALNYPMLDDRNITRSSQEITDIGIWDRQTNLTAWGIILGDRAGGAGVCGYSAPARTLDLSGLPPTFIAVGEQDLFRDEDIEYAMRLLAAGVATELHLYAGACHAFDVLAPDSALAGAFQECWFAFLRRAFR
ncbi:MAG: alpha/beta hydrolase [Sphingobium sp.]